MVREELKRWKNKSSKVWRNGIFTPQAFKEV